MCYTKLLGFIIASSIICASSQVDAGFTGSKLGHVCPDSTDCKNGAKDGEDPKWRCVPKEN